MSAEEAPKPGPQNEPMSSDEMQFRLDMQKEDNAMKMAELDHAQHMANLQGSVLQGAVAPAPVPVPIAMPMPMPMGYPAIAMGPVGGSSMNVSIN